jgi:phage gp36-like protein
MYVSQDALIELFGDDAFEGVTDELWAQVLSAVDGLIDGKLSARYTLPVSPVPPLLAAIATDLSRYKLHYLGGYDEEKNKGLKERYDYALELLNSIANGNLAISGMTPAVGINQFSAPQYSAPERIFL